MKKKAFLAVTVTSLLLSSFITENTNDKNILATVSGINTYNVPVAGVTKETSKCYKHKYLNDIELEDLPVAGVTEQFCSIEYKQTNVVNVKPNIDYIVTATLHDMQSANEEIIEETEEIIEETEEITKWWTDEEYNTFVHLLYAEAGGESDECIRYVGSVVLNRMNSKHYPDTLLGVIYQKGQYSPTWHGFMNRKVRNERCYEIANELLENGSVLPYYVLGQSSKSIMNRYKGRAYTVKDGVYFWYTNKWK